MPQIRSKEVFVTAFPSGATNRSSLAERVAHEIIKGLPAVLYVDRAGVALRPGLMDSLRTDPDRHLVAVSSCALRESNTRLRAQPWYVHAGTWKRRGAKREHPEAVGIHCVLALGRAGLFRYGPEEAGGVFKAGDVEIDPNSVRDAFAAVPQLAANEVVDIRAFMIAEDVTQVASELLGVAQTLLGVPINVTCRTITQPMVRYVGGPRS